jgi:hypothetical protein
VVLAALVRAEPEEVVVAQLLVRPEMEPLRA